MQVQHPLSKVISGEKPRQLRHELPFPCEDAASDRSSQNDSCNATESQEVGSLLLLSFYFGFLFCFLA